MTFIRKLTLAAVLATALSACAQAPVATPSDWMAKMDHQVSAMRDMHGKMTSARTAQERDALMADQMKLMQDGMGMMSEMAGCDPAQMAGKDGHAGHATPAGMAGMDMGAMHGGAGASGGMMMRHQMIEKRMEMMQHMMQMMMDRMAAAPAKQ